jgi:hypothetical protein
MDPDPALNIYESASKTNPQYESIDAKMYPRYLLSCS